MSLQCHVCSKVYNKEFNLKYHLAHHFDDRPFSCPFPGCSNAYKTKSDLKQHQKKHEKQLGLKFTCSECQKIFTSSKDLNVHRRQCLSSKKIMSRCNLCKRNFKNFEKHQREVHGKTFKFACDFDGITFKKKNGLLKHIEDVHLRLMRCHCAPCNKSFPRIQTLNRHYKSSSHKAALEALEDNDQLFSSGNKSPEEFEKPADNGCTEQDQSGFFARKVDRQLSKEDNNCAENFEDNHCSSDDEVDQEPLQSKLPSAKPLLDESTLTPAIFFEQKPVKLDESNRLEPNLDHFDEATFTTKQPLEEESEAGRKPSLLALELKRHKCKLCAQVFKAVEDFVKHFIMQHVDNLSDVMGTTSKPVKCQNSIFWRHCDLCGEVFVYLKSLRSHMETTHMTKEAKRRSTRKLNNQQEKKQCKECGEAVSGPGGIHSHMWRKHFNMQKSNYKFTCLLCKQHMASRSLAKRHHIHVHNSGKKIFRTCLECNFDFSLYEDFKKHCDTIHSNLHICYVCGIKCQSMTELLKHGKYHRSVPEHEKKFSCDLCPNFNAQQKRNLEAHMVKRHGADRRKYSATCECCGAQFDSYHTFKGHMIMHKLQKKGKQQCRHCDKAFYLTRDLKIHEDKHSKGSQNV